MATSDKITVLIVDDHDLVRAGICALLKNEKDIEVIGEAANGTIGVEQARLLSPNIVLMDITMPGENGIVATKKIVAELPTTKVLALTQHDQSEYIRRIMEAGASGYLLKSSLTGDLLNAIRTVAKGKQFVTPAIEKILAQTPHSPCKGIDSSGDILLTRREREILELIASSHTNQKTAEKLHISVRTVEFHRANLCAKLGVYDTAGLTKYAISKGLITLDASTDSL